MRNLREYCRPQTIEEALRLLTREGVRSAVLSGGTRLAAESRDDVESVIDLGGLPLAYIQSDNSGLRLGGLTRLQEMIDSPAVARFANGALTDAARLTSTRLLRNQGTLAGTLLAREVNSELAAPLLVLEAEVLIQRLEGSTTLPLADLYEDLDASIEGAIITEAFVPAPQPEARLHRCRVARTPSDRAILTVAALTSAIEGVIKEARLAAAGIGLHPRRLREIESKLKGRRARADDISAVLSRAAARIELPQDHIASADYRRSTLQVLIQRAILGD
jgi:CO/xanthine dehydrogenase FAD-binding subunit